MNSIGAGLAMFNTEPPIDKHCEKHGLDFVAKHIFRDHYTICPRCTEEADQAEKDREIARRQEEKTQWMQARIENMIGQACIPDRFLDKTIKNFVAETDQQKAVVSLAVDYAKEFANKHSGRCLIFHGKAGTGKTHIACGIALGIIKNYLKTAVFTTVSKLARNVREAKSFASHKTESQVIAAYAEPDLLIIDEIGLQSNTDAESRALFDVINERYEDRKPTIFISNLNTDEIKQALGARLFDRAREDGGSSVLFDWDSKRGDV